MKKHRIDARSKQSNNNPVKESKRPFSMMRGVDMTSTSEMSLSDVGYDITGIRLTPQRIFNMWTCASNGDPSEQVALWNHILDMDGIIASVVNTRKAAVENKKWSIIGDNEEKRERIEKILRDTQTIISPSGDLGELSQYGTNIIGMSFDRLKSFLLDAPFLGYAGAKIDWAMGGGEINTFIPIAPSNWRFTPTWGFYIQSPLGDTEYLDGDKREEYVMHYSTSKYGIPSVCGLVRPLSMLFFRKYYALLHSSRLLEKLGIPLVTASLNPQDWNNLDMIEKASRQLKNLGSDGAGVFQKDMGIDIKGVGAGNTQHFQTIIDYLDKCIAITVLGQQASTQAAGGMSNGQIQENVRMDILAGDAKAFEDTINDQIVRRIEENIWGTSECKFKIDYESASEISKISVMSDTLRKMGLEIDTDYITKNTGIPVSKKVKEQGGNGAIANILSGGGSTPVAEQAPAMEQAPIEPMPTPPTELGGGNIAENPELALASLGQTALTDTIKKCKVMAFSDINEAVVVNNYLKQLINDSDIDIGLKQRITYNLPVDPVNAINYLNNRLANAIIAQESDDDVVNKLRMQIAVLSPKDIYDRVKSELPKPEPVVSIPETVESNVVPMADAITQSETDAMINNGITPISGEQSQPDKITSFPNTSSANTAVDEGELKAVMGKNRPVLVSEFMNRLKAIKEQQQLFNRNAENIIEQVSYKYSPTEEERAKFNTDAFDTNFNQIKDVISSLVINQYHGEYKNVKIVDIVSKFLGKEFFSSIPAVTKTMQDYYNDLTLRYNKSKPIRDLVKKAVDNPESSEVIKSALANIVKTQEDLNIIRDEYSYLYNKIADDKRKENDKYNNDLGSILDKTGQQLIAKINEGIYATHNLFYGNYMDSDNVFNLNDSAYMFVVNNAKEVMSEDDYNKYSSMTNPTSKEMYVNKYVPQVVSAYQFEIFPLKKNENIKVSHKDYKEYSEFLKNTKNVADKFSGFMKRIDQLRAVDNSAKNNALNVRSDSMVGDTYYKIVGVIGTMLGAQALGAGIPLGGLAIFASLEQYGLYTEFVEGGMDKDRARWISGIASVPLAFLDHLQLDKYLGVKEDIKKILTGEIRKTIVNLTKQYGAVWLYESSTEAVQIVMAELTKKLSENADYKYGKWKDLLPSAIEQSIDALKAILGSTLFFMMPTIVGARGQVKDFRNKVQYGIDVNSKRVEDIKNAENITKLSSESKTLADINETLNNVDKIKPEDVGVDSAITLLDKEQLDRVNAYLNLRKMMASEFIPAYKDLLERFNNRGLSIFNAENRLRIANNITGMGDFGVGLKNSVMQAIGFNDENISDSGVNMAADILDNVVLLGQDSVVKDANGNTAMLKPVNKAEYSKDVDGNFIDKNGDKAEIVENGNNLYAVSADGVPMIMIENTFAPFMTEGTYSPKTGKIYFNTFLVDSKQDLMNAFIKRVITHEITHRGLSGLDSKTMNDMLLYVWDNVISKDEVAKQALADRFIPVANKYGYATKEVVDENGNTKTVADMDSIERNNAAKILLAEEYVTVKSETDDNFRNTSAGRKLMLKIKSVLRKAFPIFKFNEKEIWDIIYNARMNTTQEMLDKKYRSNLEDEALMEKDSEKYSLASAPVGTDMINNDAVSKLKKTDDFNKAGYILPDGYMLDLNRADKNTANKLDHRIVAVDNSNVGMQQFIAQGNIRYSPETNSFHILKEPTDKQYNTINRIINESIKAPTVEIDLLNDKIKKSSSGKYYDFKQLLGKTYTAMDESDRVIKDIEDIFLGREKYVSPYMKFSVSEKSPVSEYHKAVKDWMFFNIPIVGDLVSLGYNKVYFPKDTYKDVKGYFATNKTNGRDHIDDVANSIARRREVERSDIQINKIKDELAGLSEKSYWDFVADYKSNNELEQAMYEKMAREQGIDLNRAILEEEKVPFDNDVDRFNIHFRIIPSAKIQKINNRINELSLALDRILKKTETIEPDGTVKEEIVANKNAVSSNGNLYSASRGGDWINSTNEERVKIVEDDYNSAIDSAVAELMNAELEYDYASALNTVKTKILESIAGTDIELSEKEINDGKGRIYTLSDKNDASVIYTIGVSNISTDNVDYDVVYNDSINLRDINKIIVDIKKDLLENIDFLSVASEADINRKKSFVWKIISNNDELSPIGRKIITDALISSVDSLEEKKRKQEILKDIPVIKIKQTFNQFLTSVGDAYKAGKKNIITETKTANEYKNDALAYVDSIVRFERVANAIKNKIEKVNFRDIDSYIASVENVISNTKNTFDSSLSKEKNIENAKEYIRSIYAEDYKNKDILDEYIKRLDNIYKNSSINGGRIDDAVNNIIASAEKYDTFDMSLKEKEDTETMQRIVLFPEFKEGLAMGKKDAMNMIEDGIKSAVMLIKSSGASAKIRGKLLSMVAKIASNKYGGDVAKQMTMMGSIQNELDNYIESENRIAEMNRLYKTGAKIKGLLYKVSPEFFDILDSIMENSIPVNKKDLSNVISQSKRNISNKAYVLSAEQLLKINAVINSEIERIRKEVSNEEVKLEMENELLDMQKEISKYANINIKTLSSEELSIVNNFINKFIDIIKSNSDIFDTNRQIEMVENRGVFKRESVAKHIMEHPNNFMIGELISNQITSNIAQSIIANELENKKLNNAIAKLENKIIKLDANKDADKIAEIEKTILNLKASIIVSRLTQGDVTNTKEILSKNISSWNNVDIGYLSAILKEISKGYLSSFTEHNKRSMKTILMLSDALGEIHRDMRINNTSFAESYKNIITGLGDDVNTKRHISNISKLSGENFNSAKYYNMRYFITALQYLANNVDSIKNKLMIGNKDSNAFYNTLYWISGNVSTKDMNWNLRDLRKNVTYLLENTLSANAKTLSLLASADPLNKFKEVLFDNINNSENSASYNIKKMVRMAREFMDKNGFVPFTKEEQEKMTLSIGMDDIMGRVFGVWENIKRGDLSEKGASDMLGEIFKYQNKRAEFFDIELAGRNGEKQTITITPAIAMDVYAYMLADSIREDKYKVIKDNNEGMVVYLGDGRPNQHTIADNELGNNNAPLNKENAEKIVSILSPREKQYVELMLQFISDEASPILKIAYENYFNKPFKGEMLYWSILRSPLNGKQIDVKKLSELGYEFNMANFTIDKSGRLITRLPNVNAPIVLKDFMVKTGDIFRFIANFSGYIDSLNKFNDLVTDPKTRLEIEQIPGYGSRLINDIDFYKKRLTGGLQNSTNPNFFSDLLQNMVRVPLILNVTSIASQAASYPVGTSSNDLDIFSDGSFKQMPKSYALNVYNMFKALSRGLVYDGTFGIKNITMPDGKKGNKQDLFMDDLIHVYPSLIDRARGGFSNKHINDKISDYDISRQLMGREPERSYWLYPQFMFDRGTMTQIVFDVANYVFKKNGLNFNEELDKRVKNNIAKPIALENSKYFEMLKEVGELSWKLYEAQSQGAIPYTASIEAMPIMKVFGLAFRNAWTQMLINTRNEMNEIHNDSLLGGKVEMKKWINFFKRHKQSMVIMGLFMAFIKGLFSYDWDKKRNMPYWSGYEEKDGEDIFGTSDNVFMQFLKQAGVESIMSKAGMAPYFQSILYSLKHNTDIVGNMFSPYSKKASSAVKEIGQGIIDSDWDKTSSGMFKIASVLTSIIRGIPMDRADKLYNIMEYHAEKLTEKPSMSNDEIKSILEKQAEEKKKLMNPNAPVNLDVNNKEKNTGSYSDRTRLSLADYNAIRLARILIEEKNAINKLTQDFEDKKKEIEPYLKNEVINVPNQGSVYFVNGSVSNRIDPEKVKQGLIKIARVSPEIADALIKKWSNVREMSQYVKISDKDNITKNQEV